MESGIPGIGFVSFVSMVMKVRRKLSADSLAPIIFKYAKKEAKDAGLKSVHRVKDYL